MGLFAKKLKTAREEKGLSQKDISTALNYSSAQFVSNWERGLARPPVEAVPFVAKALGIAPKVVFEWLMNDIILELKARYEHVTKAPNEEKKQIRKRRAHK